MLLCTRTIILLWHYSSLRVSGTALHKAPAISKADVVRFLIGKGAGQSIKDINGRTAIESAQMSSTGSDRGIKERVIARLSHVLLHIFGYLSS